MKFFFDSSLYIYIVNNLNLNNMMKKYFKIESDSFINLYYRVFLTILIIVKCSILQL